MQTLRNRSRTAVRGKGWKQPLTIDTKKFEAVSTAILSVLPSRPIAFSQLVSAVKKQLKTFQGSVPWYTITCLRELEMRGKVKRQLNPTRYLKP